MTDRLSAERVIAQTAGGLVLLVGGLALLGLFFPAEVRFASTTFVDAFGAWGVLAGVYVADFITFPIPPDAYLAAGRIGGLSFTEVVLAGSVGSLLGGLSGYGVSRALASTGWFVNHSGPGVARARALFERYGGVALAVAAVTPLPFSLLSYASGSLGLPVSRYLLIALLRVPRMAAYLFAIELGVFDLLR